MTNGLDQALEFLLEEEGGWSNHPADRGGKTMYGVTQAVYDDYRVRLKKTTKQTVAKITKAEAREIYDVLYWRACGADRLPWPISYITFDAAVNSGVSRAVRWTQAGLQVPQDGKLGPGTVAAATKAVANQEGSSLFAIVDQRVQFLAALVKRSPSQSAFLLGWWRRTIRVLSRALLSEIDE
jgi:lysozyme family protein